MEFNNKGITLKTVDVEKDESFGCPNVCAYLVGRALLSTNLGRIVTLKITKLPICGVGGIFEPMDALQYLLLGCSAVEMCSAVYFKGYEAFKYVIDGIKEWMERKGYTQTSEFIEKVKKNRFC